MEVNWLAVALLFAILAGHIHVRALNNRIDKLSKALKEHTHDKLTGEASEPSCGNPSHGRGREGQATSGT